MKEIVVNKSNQGQRIDKYLLKLLPEASSGFIYKMLRKKNITLNDKKCDGKEIINVNDSIKIFFSDETFEKFSGKTINGSDNKSLNKTTLKSSHKESVYERAYKSIKGIEVVFENEDIIIVNKPVGVICQQDSNNNISLNEWIVGYLLNKGYEITDYTPSICNRIDFNTSGLVIGAKTYRGSRYCFDAISSHRLNKYYIAICEGIITENIVLEDYLIKDENINKVKIINKSDKTNINSNLNNANKITTKIYPIESVQINDKWYSLLKINLITGKPHQIRAHLSSIGHPLSGDIKYGGKPFNGVRHQLLHAYQIDFPYEDDIDKEMGFSKDNHLITSKLSSVYTRYFKKFDIY